MRKPVNPEADFYPNSADDAPPVEKQSSASPACSIAPSPRLKTGDLDCVMHGDGTLEVRCSGRVGIHMVKSETADFLQWINQHQKQ